jgi:hypothetical protein
MELLFLYKVPATKCLAVLNHKIPRLLELLTGHIPTHSEVYYFRFIVL